MILRLATPEDVPALRKLIDASVRALQAQDYTPEQIELALAHVFGTDAQLISDGTYFVVETTTNWGETAIAGCGGWSKRRTLYGGDHTAGRSDELLDPAREAAKIRAFFVHPDWSRRGVGSTILEACEKAAIQAGFSICEMGATLTGERLFRARGYRVIERIEVPLGEGLSLPVVRMGKSLAPAAGE